MQTLQTNQHETYSVCRALRMGFELHFISVTVECCLCREQTARSHYDEVPNEIIAYKT